MSNFRKATGPGILDALLDRVEAAEGSLKGYRIMMNPEVKLAIFPDGDNFYRRLPVEANKYIPIRKASDESWEGDIFIVNLSKGVGPVLAHELGLDRGVGYGK